VFLPMRRGLAARPTTGAIRRASGWKSPRTTSHRVSGLGLGCGHGTQGREWSPAVLGANQSSEALRQITFPSQLPGDAEASIACPHASHHSQQPRARHESGGKRRGGSRWRWYVHVVRASRKSVGSGQCVRGRCEQQSSPGVARRPFPRKLPGQIFIFRAASDDVSGPSAVPPSALHLPPSTFQAQSQPLLCVSPRVSHVPRGRSAFVLLFIWACSWGQLHGGGSMGCSTFPGSLGAQRNFTMAAVRDFRLPSNPHPYPHQHHSPRITGL
jgi:hypothetical protein